MDDDSVSKVALDFEVRGKRKRERPKKTWKKQVKEDRENIALKKEDFRNREKYRDVARTIVEEMG